ncbi:MAG: aspartate/tyrosine/aromatic aminotransferase [Alphaproteobacteria bacterium]|nr:MAG: aspartate/tyrosine/aromatic aminotransferase [Alphaproteobacteria bacterium]
MLEKLTPQPADKILALMSAFRADPRPEKLDLGVGVYRNAEGVTPVMRAIKTAEKRLWETETTKTYTALCGDPAFGEAMAELVLGGVVPRERLATCASVGGTGAVRQILELYGRTNPGGRVWVPAPTWPNHVSILRHLGIEMVEYRYFDEASCALDFAGMMADLEGARAGELVLLHGCCHNPTGANPTAAQWREIGDLLEKSGAIPFIDIAYQGFGDGLEADAAGVRHLAERLPEMLIAASCSKNFGIYRERTGCIIAVAPDGASRDLAAANFAHMNRQNFSFPPDHGARLVTMVLTDPELRRQWQEELEEMRLGMLAIREQLAEELRRRTGSDRFGFIAEHRGMFSRLGLSPAEVEALREKHAVYMVGDSRINIAGLNAQTVPRLAAAIADVLGAGA